MMGSARAAFHVSDQLLRPVATLDHGVGSPGCVEAAGSVRAARATRAVPVEVPASVPDKWRKAVVRSCLVKVAHQDITGPLTAMADLGVSWTDTCGPYLCPLCEHWHWGRRSSGWPGLPAEVVAVYGPLTATIRTLLDHPLRPNEAL